MKLGAKFIFVTGGVLSGLGKGVSAASLGRLLKARGYKIFVQKFDPYYNVDPGTMSPYQHGEVYVTQDGGETDLDLGHYERFIGESFTKESNYVQGKLLLELLEEERAGKYGGHTIQVIPHVTDKIIHKIEAAAKNSKADFIITEIGGTVGDIESQPFISAINQFSKKYKNQTFFIHATFVPYLEASKEFKSKPTQNSIMQLNSLGISPDMILLRANKPLPEQMISKIATKAYMEANKCISVPNADNIYKVPLYFEKCKMAQIIEKHFQLKPQTANLKNWVKYVKLIDHPHKQKIKLGFIGKYVEFHDAYKSIIEATKVAANWQKLDVKIKWIQAETLTKNNVKTKLKGLDGAIILPGFGTRGFEGQVWAAQYTREADLPTLGICYGMQAMVLSYAIKNGIKDATSSEISTKGSYVIDFIRGKSENDKFGGTLRLGASKSKLVKNSVVAKIYKATQVFERHRHRYEINPQFIDQIQTPEFIFSGFDEQTKLAEYCEMPFKKFYIGIQAHPEFNSRPLEPHPLFMSLLKTAAKK